MEILWATYAPRQTKSFLAECPISARTFFLTGCVPRGLRYLPSMTRHPTVRIPTLGHLGTTGILRVSPTYPSASYGWASGELFDSRPEVPSKVFVFGPWTRT